MTETNRKHSLDDIGAIYNGATDQEVAFMQTVSLFTSSAQWATNARPGEILEACFAALKGRTPDEPDPNICARDIEIHGFHLFRGVFWGLLFDLPSPKIQLVRLKTGSEIKRKGA